MTTGGLGIAWYRREDYERLKAMFIDGDNLPDTYDEWLTIANRTYNVMSAGGLVVVKALIDPETFPEWCSANGEKLDRQARSTYAAKKAAAMRKT